MSNTIVLPRMTVLWFHESSQEYVVGTDEGDIATLSCVEAHFVDLAWPQEVPNGSMVGNSYNIVRVEEPAMVGDPIQIDFAFLSYAVPVVKVAIGNGRTIRCAFDEKTGIWRVGR